ncbi:MAG TPA: STM3941 family protein [Glaciihabitans sp.]|jgi:hypothetical protein|nr:STM3941 family protein [Glaciihabitans sp.]
MSFDDDPMAAGNGSSTSSSRSTLEPIDLAPSIPRILLFASLCVAFVAVAVGMLASSPTFFQAFIAVFGIAFFGVGGLWALAKVAREQTGLRLSPDGLHPISGGVIPWADVEHVGSGKTAGTTIIGIRLRSYNAYVASLTPAQISLALRASTVAKRFGAVTAPFSRGQRGGFEALASLPHTKEGVAAQLWWSRTQTGGFDVSFSPLLFKGGAPRVVSAITEYQAAWMAHRR